MRKISALRVGQWLPEWNDVKWNDELLQGRPLEHFYVLSMPANLLRELSGVYRREAKPGEKRTIDSGTQRFHDAARSEEISRFIRYGYPWSDLGPKQREEDAFVDLQKPGWLPTSIVVNILVPGDSRNEKTIRSEDSIQISDDRAFSELTLPPPRDSFEVPPIEVIDGQHRLWAFNGDQISDDFELPVIAFHGLGRSWQAYLFWTINIKPKRINPSLAYDLYPLLRGEDWLDKTAGHSIYRETRAQEMVENLWSYPQSPWFARINMLGERGTEKTTISQAAWIRSLMATFLKPWKSVDDTVGGLFGAPRGQDRTTLEWGRPLQSALLIMIWQFMAEGLAHRSPEDSDLFSESRRLITSDQGVRAVLSVFNDLLVANNKALDLTSISLSSQDEASKDEIEAALAVLSENNGLVKTLSEFSRAVSEFDWLPYGHASLDDAQRRQKAGYRGSGGYKLLRQDLFTHVSQSVESVGLTKLHGTQTS